MYSIILFIHLFVAFVIVVLVLVQQGKGADAGASFGSGSSQTVFGSEGAGNFLTQSTTVLAATFFATSFSLALLTKNELGNKTPTFPTNAQEQQAPSAPPAAGKTGAQDVPAGVVPVPGGGSNEAPNTAPKTDAQNAPAGVVPIPGGNTNQKPKTDADVPIKE